MSSNQNKQELEQDFPEKVNLPDEVIVITGGSGFLGQHIVRVLQERAEGIKEIRIADTVPYVKKLTFAQKFPIEFYSTDITVESQLDQPFKGATTVIHSAASIEVGHYVDRERMRGVNFTGTLNVIKKCREFNVEKLVFTSTVDAIISKDSNFVDQSEEGVVQPSREEDCLIGYYGFTKAQGEEIVLKSNDVELDNGKILKTTVLRPTVFYGELDPYYVPAVLKTAKKTWGYLPKPARLPKGAVLQSTYVGNVAWGHVLAVRKLREEVREEGAAAAKAGSCAANGQVFFITDDTPPRIMYDFMESFLVLRGSSLVQIPVPMFVLGVWVFLVTCLVGIFPDSWKKTVQANPLFPTFASFQMVHKRLHFNRSKANECLQYSPIYSEIDSLKLSSEHYKDVTI